MSSISSINSNMCGGVKNGPPLMTWEMRGYFALAIFAIVILVLGIKFGGK